MYTTIEADLENGRLTSSEHWQLPAQAHVLVTLLNPPPDKKPNWQLIKPLLGTLKLRGDTREWQRSIRSEWS